MELTSPFIEYLGLSFTETSGSRVVATWEVDERHHQPFGSVHGGVHASVVETLGSIGGTLWWRGQAGAEAACVGVSNTTDFFRAVSSGELASTGTPVHQGRSQQLWLVETHDDRGRLVASGRLRLHNLG